MHFFKIIINDDEWTFYVVDDNDDVVTDADNWAEVVFDNREVYFRRSGITEINVRHELFHIYFGYTYTQNSNLDYNQSEELACSLFGQKGDMIITKSQLIFNKLKEVANEPTSN